MVQKNLFNFLPISSTSIVITKGADEEPTGIRLGATIHLTRKTSAEEPKLRSRISEEIYQTAGDRNSLADLNSTFFFQCTIAVLQVLIRTGVNCTF